MLIHQVLVLDLRAVNPIVASHSFTDASTAMAKFTELCQAYGFDANGYMDNADDMEWMDRAENWPIRVVMQASECTGIDDILATQLAQAISNYTQKQAAAQAIQGQSSHSPGVTAVPSWDPNDPLSNPAAVPPPAKAAAVAPPPRPKDPDPVPQEASGDPFAWLNK